MQNNFLLPIISSGNSKKNFYFSSKKFYFFKAYSLQRIYRSLWRHKDFTWSTGSRIWIAKRCCTSINISHQFGSYIASVFRFRGKALQYWNKNNKKNY